MKPHYKWTPKGPKFIGYLFPERKGSKAFPDSGRMVIRISSDAGIESAGYLSKPH